jgi:hypothetical protein
MKYLNIEPEAETELGYPVFCPGDSGRELQLSCRSFSAAGWSQLCATAMAAKTRKRRRKRKKGAKENEKRKEQKKRRKNRKKKEEKKGKKAGKREEERKGKENRHSRVESLLRA